jgi:hypothetical protein
MDGKFSALLQSSNLPVGIQVRSEVDGSEEILWKARTFYGYRIHHLKTILKAENVMNVLYNASNADGLFSDTWSLEGMPRTSSSLWDVWNRRKLVLMNYSQLTTGVVGLGSHVIM